MDQPIWSLTTLGIQSSRLLMTSSTNELPNFWKEGEQTNGRLAMIGFLVLIHNYVLFGWIIPGIF